MPFLHDVIRIRPRAAVLVTLLLLGLVPVVPAQFIQNENPNYTPPSPDAAALLEYASLPVTLHTGTVEVSVPLGKLETRKTTIPISVSYHASGIKVQDLASSVGLGWVLNAGGAITRIVRGLPDDGPQGYYNRDFNATYDDISHLVWNTVDGEPDIYFFNFMGMQGRMVMDPNKNLIPLPEQNLKITKPNFASADPMWQITDTKGITYVFGKTAASREISNVTRHTQYAPNPQYPDPSPNWHDDSYSAITTWYLTEIIYPYSTDVITFTYRTGGSVYYENYSQSQSSDVEIWDGCGIGGPDPNVLDHINQITVPAPKYISTITSSVGYADFLYASREDLANALRLTRVRIISGDVVKSYSLNNATYFVSDGCTAADCKRLKLSGIDETTNLSQIRYRMFDYSTINLPPRNSVKYDHWGYYNNNTYANAIAPSKVYHKYMANTDISFPGADKNPVLSRTTANILQKIVNAGGGIQQIFYELNQYDNNGTTTNTGGVRVVKIVEDDGTGLNPVLEKNYKYTLVSNTSRSSGVRYRNYNYDYQMVANFNCDDPISSGQLVSGITTAQRFSSSAVDLFDINGSHVGYSDVQVEYPNGSKEQHFFTSTRDRPDIAPEFSIPDGYNDHNSADFISVDGPPFVPYSDRSWERGLLTKQIFFNDTGKKVKEITNRYEFYQASSAEAPGVKAMVLAISTFVWARRGKYKYSHRGVRLLENTEKTFDVANQAKRFSKTTSYTYSSTYSTLVKEATTQLNDGSAVKLEYKYPFDYGTPSNTFPTQEAMGVEELKSWYRISIPLETTAWLKSASGQTFKVIESKLVTYRGTTSGTYTVNPYQVFKLKVDGPVTDFVPGTDTRYQVIHTYDTYDNFGNLTQETPQHGVVKKYTWGVNSSVLSTETKSPADGPHTTTYNYMPMIGLSSVVDPAGQRKTYVYDYLSRLKLVKDHNGNILTRYRYHYADQFEFSSLFTVTGTLRVNLSQTFTATSAEPIGTTTYTWNFGDGQSSVGTTPTAYHTYTNVGTYRITLTKTNPEYGTSEMSVVKQITN